METYSMNKLFEFPFFGTALAALHSDVGGVKNVKNQCERKIFFFRLQQDTLSLLEGEE